MTPSGQIVVGAIVLYGVIGLAVAVAFVLRGIDRVVEPPQAISGGARLLFVPGAAALWPLVLRRWMAAPRKGSPI